MPSPCPNCNKMCSLENGEPEVINTVEISDGIITASIRVARQSACCSEDMKEYTYECSLDVTSAITDHEEKFHNSVSQEYDVDEGDCEVNESGGGRYAKNMICVCLSVDVTCQGEHVDTVETSVLDGREVTTQLAAEVANVGTFELIDETNAGSFEELV